MARGLGVRLHGVVFMDASTGIAIGSRRGQGKVKRIYTVFLWVQEVVQSGRIHLRKRHTSEMLADPLTKAVSEPKLRYMLKACGFVSREGRHELSLKV